MESLRRAVAREMPLKPMSESAGLRSGSRAISLYIHDRMTRVEKPGAYKRAIGHSS